MYTPADLPINTTIESQAYGYWTKVPEGFWVEDDAHCGDCQEVILDDPNDIKLKQIAERQYPKVLEDFSLEYFGAFRIVSVPWEVALSLAKSVSEYELQEWHRSSVDEVLREAFMDYMKTVKEKD